MSESGVKRKDLLRLLLSDTSTTHVRGGWYVRTMDTPGGGEFFLAEGVVRVPPRTACAMVREADLTPLAGRLAEWKVIRSDAAAPRFARCVQYTSRLPWPFADRNFNVEGWFLPETSLPPHLKGATVYVSQTSPGAAPLRLRNAGGVDGDVEISAYVFMSVPGDANRCFVRRVFCIDLKMGLPPWMLRASFVRAFESNFVWMDRPGDAAAAALRERIAADPAYASVFPSRRGR